METTGRPRKHRSMLEEHLKKLEARDKPMKVDDKVKAPAPVDVDPAPVATAPVQGKQVK